MHCGEKVIAAALSYGFETQAGFYKAFEKVTGSSPKKLMRSELGAAEDDRA